MAQKQRAAQAAAHTQREHEHELEHGQGQGEHRFQQSAALRANAGGSTAASTATSVSTVAQQGKYFPFPTTPVGGMSAMGMGLNTGYIAQRCCNVCPEEKFPGRYIGDSFKPAGGDAGAPSFLEAMEGRRRRQGAGSGRARKGGGMMGGMAGMAAGIAGGQDPNKIPAGPGVMGGGTECCPTCPSLEQVVNGPLEPFGGPFGIGRLGGRLAKELERDHANDPTAMDPAYGMAAGAGMMGALRL